MPEAAPDRAAFIRQNLAVVVPANLPELRLYQAHPGSRLARTGTAPPYWAYVWAGGAALARHVLDHPDLVRGLHVLDLGAGSGVVAIAAAKAGAASVAARDPDPWGQAAVAVNAALNAVAVAQDLPRVDIVLCGDVFYSPEVAAQVMAQLDAFCAAGITVLVGDPGRADLPVARLTRIADYRVQDMGDAPGHFVTAAIFAYDRR